MRGALAVALGLIALQWVTSSTLPGLSTALAYPAQLVAKWMDPTVALIGDQTTTATSAPAATPQQSAAAQQGQALAGVANAAQWVTNVGLATGL